MSRKVLVTGGAGYIGSHCVIELFKAGFDVLIVDNLYNASEECLNRLEKITERKIERLNLDICDKQALNDLFQNNTFYAVLHLAALKAVSESVSKPLDYYRTNVVGTLNVLDVIFLIIYL
jgi:UDP-glucose 4-epimerase